MKILFICSGNTCRSPMAQALFLQQITSRAGNDLSVMSAGIMAYPGAPATNSAVEAMREFNIDLSRHRAQLLNPDLVDEADLILTMTAHQCSLLQKKYPHKRENILTISNYAGLGDEDVDDPFGMTIEDYSRTAKQIKAMVERIVDRLLG